MLFSFPKTNNQQIFILVTILLVGLCYRLYAVNEKTWWMSSDSGRDVMISYYSQEVIDQNILPKVGSDNVWLKNSPLYYFFVNTLFLASGRSIELLLMFVVTIHVLSIYLCFELGKLLKGIPTGLTVALFYALSNFFITVSQILFQPFIALPFFIVSIYFLFKATVSQKQVFSYLALLFSFITFQLHLSYISVLILAILFLIKQMISDLRQNKIASAINAFSFVVLTLMSVLFLNINVEVMRVARAGNLSVNDFFTNMVMSISLLFSYYREYFVLFGSILFLVPSLFFLKGPQKYMYFSLIALIMLFSFYSLGSETKTEFYYHLPLFFVSLLSLSIVLSALKQTFLITLFAVFLNAGFIYFVSDDIKIGLTGTRYIVNVIESDFKKSNPDIAQNFLIVDRSNNTNDYGWGSPSYWLLESNFDSSSYFLTKDFNNLAPKKDNISTLYVVCANFGGEEGWIEKVCRDGIYGSDIFNIKLDRVIPEPLINDPSLYFEVYALRLNDA